LLRKENEELKKEIDILKNISIDIIRSPYAFNDNTGLDIVKEIKSCNIILFDI